MRLQDVVQAWDAADPAAIHPTREHDSEAAYWASGKDQAAQLATVLKPGARVVDFGCGDGRVAIPLHALGYDVTAADSSQRMLDRLTTLAPKLPTVQSDGTDLHAKLRRKVDAVICLAVLIHHDYTAGQAIIAGLTAAVKRGGLLILDWPVSDQPSERQHWIGVTTWPAQRQAELAASLGLTPIDTDLPWTVWRV